MQDPTHGYDAFAEQFMKARSDSGATFVAQWAKTRPRHTSIIDIGCGHGYPLTQALIDAGLDVHALDASPAMVRAFEARFPDIPVVCDNALTTDFLGQTFDAVLAVGLVFLLPKSEQGALIKHLAKTLNTGGTFLFSAPWQIGSWKDLITGETSHSLGKEAYEAICLEAGLKLITTHCDEAGTHYYEMQRRT